MSKSKIIHSNILYRGKWLTLRRDEISKPDGTKATHEIVLRNNGIIIIPVYKEKILITRMYRYPIDDYSWEFPMGFINKKEDSVLAAKRELEEETGLIPLNTQFLGEIWAWSGLLNQKIFVFVATEFEEGSQKLEKTENDLIFKFVSKDGFQSMVRENVIRNTATLAAYQMWNSHEKR